VALYQDPRIVELHNRAVRCALSELEKLAETRVRKAGQNAERVTGNIMAACFEHDTSRELDPHLHTHCVVFNATFDAVEGRWKALQTVGMYRAQKFAENLYFHEMAKGLRSLGYEIENNARNFEIKNVPASVIARFSKRHQQIEAEAKRRVAQGYDGDLGELRSRIAHELRRSKIKNSTANELRSHWGGQLDSGERRALAALRAAPAGTAHAADVGGIVAWADEHLFERRSVVNDYELMAAALSRGRGEGFELADLSRAIEGRDYLREKDSRKLTSRELLRCELDIVLAVRDGRNRFLDLHPDYKPDPGLSAEQARAARRILTSRDFVTVFRGGAGTGKSHTLKEIERTIAATDRPVVVLAPQRQQASDLQNDGLPAQTLAQALTTRQLPPKVVVILDEAGQVGGRDLRKLIRLVQTQQGRLILSGDTRQHGAVAASDALRAIEKHARPRVAVLRTIRRQDPALAQSVEERRFIRGYRTAVKRASEGKIAESFDRLDRMGAIRELPDGERRAALAGEFLAAESRGERSLVVAQTWAEVHAANDAIRSAMRSAGKLEAGTTLTTFQPIDRSEAQKRDPRFYEPGQAAVFLRRYGRFSKGELCEIAGAGERGVVLIKDGRRSMVSYRYADRIAVAKATEMEVAPGDRLQLKASGRSVEGARLNNGELVTVERVEPNGNLAIQDEHGTTKTLAPAQRLFVRGFAVTSYGSQGKTVDTVLFSDAGSRAATNAQQWYVTISRGKRRVVVFTSDKAQLRAGIEQPHVNDLALDRNGIELGVQVVRQQTQRNGERIDLAQRHQQAMRMNAREGRGMKI
jgi:ATP-dependent exoDNAse (exonuclease V) alpha subunit